MHHNCNSNSNSNSNNNSNPIAHSLAHKCPICHHAAHEPINLRCDHHPCYQCAIPLLQLDQESQHCLESRYRIICPVPNCLKKTITYDLRHLIISNTEVDEDMYVTSKYVTRKAEATCANVSVNINGNGGAGSRKSSGQLQANSNNYSSNCRNNSNNNYMG